ncbi:MAG: YigZ family protein [Chlorobi bacterium]|nr:YigZ family protein [Chlorobiota bacterium]
MLFEDTYRTITSNFEGSYKEKGSKFIAFALPSKNEAEVKKHLEGLRKKYYDARHHCYAYRLGTDKSATRMNDDGEPSGTAGRPIFGQILSNDLTNILIVVIRYFGGTKLGVSGLINAYKTATKDALENTRIVTKTIKDIYGVDFKYERMNNVMKIIKDENLNMLESRFEMDCSIKFEVRKKCSQAIYEKFSKINNLKIKYLYTN